MIQPILIREAPAECALIVPVLDAQGLLHLPVIVPDHRLIMRSHCFSSSCPFSPFPAENADTVPALSFSAKAVRRIMIIPREEKGNWILRDFCVLLKGDGYYEESFRLCMPYQQGQESFF